MRTQDPASIRPDFESAINDVEAAFVASEGSIPDDPNRKLIAEYLFVAMASLLEGFISDLVIAYINSNAQKFKEFFIKQMEISPKDEKDEQAQRAKKVIEMSMPHLTLKQAKRSVVGFDYSMGC